MVLNLPSETRVQYQEWSNRVNTHVARVLYRNTNSTLLFAFGPILNMHNLIGNKKIYINITCKSTVMKEKPLGLNIVTLNNAENCMEEPAEP